MFDTMHMFLTRVQLYVFVCIICVCSLTFSSSLANYIWFSHTVAQCKINLAQVVGKLYRSNCSMKRNFKASEECVNVKYTRESCGDNCFSPESFFHSPSSNNIYIVSILPLNKVLPEQFQVLANPQLIVLFIISINLNLKLWRYINWLKTWSKIDFD